MSLNEQLEQTAEEKYKEASDIFLAVYGKIIKQSNIEPYYYHLVASNLGYADATFALGRMYFNEQITNYYSETRKRAFVWYKYAAKEGSVEALFNMGCMFYYDQGQGEKYWHNCKKDAFKCLKEAAEAGHAVAQFRTGYMYYKGRNIDTYKNCGADQSYYGINQDYEKATYWFEKAIESMKNF